MVPGAGGGRGRYDAFTGGPNQAVQALYTAIDRKVAAQMQDLDQRRQGLAGQRDAIGMQHQAGMDRLAQMDVYRLGYIEQARRTVDAIKQQTTSPIVTARADEADRKKVKHADRP